MPETKISRFVPRTQKWLIACLIAVSVVDSVLVGYNSSLMGSLNVMPTYQSYFTLITATKSLNTSISYIGGAVAALAGGFLCDWRGRRESIFWAALIAMVGGVIQGSAQNIGMFIAGRLIVGCGMGLAQTAAPILVAETLSVKYRAFALGLYYACWGVGTLIASGVCYAVTPSVFAIAILFFVPESPRWLISRDRHNEAMEILEIMNDGSADDVHVQYREIVDTLRFEKEQNLSLRKAITSSAANRKRLFLATTFSIIIMLPGTNMVTFYFGDMLSTAGISDPQTQLEVNLVLTSWTLVVAIIASWYTDKLGRKVLCSLSLTGQIVVLFLLAGLTKLYSTSSNTSGIYGTISMIFFYNAFYAWGITPLTVLYPPEILSFELRGVGMGLYTMSVKLCGLFITMVAPFGLEAIGYQMYIVNACFDILMVAFVIYFWVETRGLSLEEVDQLFDPTKREVIIEHVKEDIGGETISIEEKN
ncbi:general substrate transporter [Pyrenochaeta sp. DS3sAY3a]|nr:general substrate transporter [Pyrenochaeta sp. DS3sAY3a]